MHPLSYFPSSHKKGGIPASFYLGSVPSLPKHIIPAISAPFLQCPFLP